MNTKIIAYILGISVGLLIVAPPIVYDIPMFVNSGGWLYSVMVAGFFGMLFLLTDAPKLLKILLVYLFFNSFYSQIPYLSFNAYILCVVAAFAFWGFTKVETKPILTCIVAAFLLECAMVFMQQLGHDTLLNFTNPNQKVFFGTVMQYMRLSSVFVVMTPLLIIYDKRLFIPLLILCCISSSSTFALALALGVGTYVFIEMKKLRKFFLWVIGFFIVIYLCLDSSVYAELHWGRWTVWPDIIRSGVYDTSIQRTLPLSGPLDLKACIFGRGMDTFLPLFPVYKHDPNPFPDAHNDFLQFWWELGLVGFGIMGLYLVQLFRRIKFNTLLLSGFVCTMVGLFFTFPTRMTQSMFIVLYFLAYCEKEARKKENGHVS